MKTYCIYELRFEGEPFYVGKGNPSCREDVKKKRSEFLKNNNPMHNKETKRKTIEKIRKSCAKSVIKCDKFGKEIEKFCSIREAAKNTKANKKGISDCCNGKLKTSGGFTWKFEGRIGQSHF